MQRGQEWPLHVKVCKVVFLCLRKQLILLVVLPTSFISCTVVDCNPLTAPANGLVDHPQTTFMSTATYSCDTGYVVEGQATRMCQADGTWSGSEPTCRVGE